MKNEITGILLKNMKNILLNIGWKRKKKVLDAMDMSKNRFERSKTGKNRFKRAGYSGKTQKRKKSKKIEKKTKKRSPEAFFRKPLIGSVF